MIPDCFDASRTCINVALLCVCMSQITRRSPRAPTSASRRRCSRTLTSRPRRHHAHRHVYQVGGGVCCVEEVVSLHTVALA